MKKLFLVVTVVGMYGNMQGSALQFDPSNPADTALRVPGLELAADTSINPYARGEEGRRAFILGRSTAFRDVAPFFTEKHTTSLQTKIKLDARSPQETVLTLGALRLVADDPTFRPRNCTVGGYEHTAFTQGRSSVLHEIAPFLAAQAAGTPFTLTNTVSKQILGAVETVTQQQQQLQGSVEKALGTLDEQAKLLNTMPKGGRAQEIARFTKNLADRQPLLTELAAAAALASMVYTTYKGVQWLRNWRTIKPT